MELSQLALAPFILRPLLTTVTPQRQDANLTPLLLDDHDFFDALSLSREATGPMWFGIHSPTQAYLQTLEYLPDWVELVKIAQQKNFHGPSHSSETLYFRKLKILFILQFEKTFPLNWSKSPHFLQTEFLFFLENYILILQNIERIQGYPFGASIIKRPQLTPESQTKLKYLEMDLNALYELIYGIWKHQKFDVQNLTQKLNQIDFFKNAKNYFPDFLNKN
ncbi:MAG: hypothetical protein K1X29_01875 [Bdellovibrionales bacterium]|nr:hypothetical protein [Bdellovibrionales bacterium]